MSALYPVTTSMVHKLPRFVGIVNVLTKTMRTEAGKFVVAWISERQFPSKSNHHNKQCPDQTNDQEMVDQPKHIRSQGVHLETPKSQTTLTFSHERA
jgi:hypothetical protein